METYLLAIGWWNFLGSFFMISLFNVSLGKKVMNEWTGIFSVPFELDYWSRFWMAWAIGLNIFFGLANIYAAQWRFIPLMKFCVITDLVAYILFILLAYWGVRSKRTGAGIYSVFMIFSFWIGWGIYALNF